MGKHEIFRIVDLMDRALVNRQKPEVLAQVAEGVTDLCRKFPVYKT
jgi:glycine/serine hydroxymethyltransferase